MKKVLTAFIALIFLSAYLLPADKETFKKLYALEGTWCMKTKRGAVCEEWIKLDKNNLQGKGYFIRGDDTLINERVALANTKEGIVYTSTVENQNNKTPIAFKMTKAEGNMFVFENSQHDFPKRIVYNLAAADSLHAYIDDGTENKRQHYYYKRQKK